MSQDVSTSTSTTNNKRIIRPSGLADRWGVSRPTIYREIKRGVLPKPMQLTPRAVGWWLTEIEAIESEWARSSRIAG